MTRPPEPAPLKNLDPPVPSQSLREWLAQIGLAQYQELLEKHAVDLEVLPELSEQDLTDLGIPLGHRKRLLKAIRAPIDGAATVPVAGPAKADSPRPQEDPHSGAGERRQLTVMFCDLVGSTALSEKLDPEELRSVLHDYRTVCGEVIARYEGFVARYVGDGILTYFGWPKAHEEDAERSVRAALEIVQAMKRLSFSEPLSVRIGIATGPVVVGEQAGEFKLSVVNGNRSECFNLAKHAAMLHLPARVMSPRLSHGAFVRGALCSDREGR
jgi:hypothetical protein